MSSLLQTIDEMARRVGSFPEYNSTQLQQTIDWFSDAEIVSPAEGGKLEVIKKVSSNIAFGLRRTSDKQLFGWMLFETKRNEFGNLCYPLIIVYLLPQFRKTGAILVLLNAVKELLDAPVYIDGAIFSDGQTLISSLIKRNMFKLFTVDKSSGQVSQYKTGDIGLDGTKSIFIEDDALGLYGKYLPGSPDRTYFNLFEDLHKELGI